MREWYRRGDNAERQRASQRAARIRNIEEARAYDRWRGHREYGEGKDKARNVIGKAIIRGEVKRGPCEVCGRPNGEAHHPDYSKPLEVRWLCREHHMALHRKVGTVPWRDRHEDTAADAEREAQERDAYEAERG